MYNYFLSQESPSFAEALQSNQYHISWTSCNGLPCRLYKASVAVTTAGDEVYVTPGKPPDNNSLDNVYHHDIQTDH